MLSKSLTLFAAVLAVILHIGAASVARSATAEVRGTWLTTTGADHIRSGFSTADVMHDLRDIGFNTVYVETWKNGYTNFPSSVLANFTGGPDRSPFLGGRDLVEETSIHAHRQGLAYLGWFEYGLAAQYVGSGGSPSNPLANTLRNNGWLLQDQAGNYGNASNGYAWANPAVPEVRQLLIDITLEAVDRYDLDGVQFDDRLAWPREFGWDATTAAIYQQETGRSLPTNIDDSRFRAWRQSKVTLFADELSAAIRARRPDLQLSISPSVTSFSDNQYNAEWPEWQDAHLFDEYAVQVYRDNIASFNATIDGQVDEFSPGDLDELVVGLRGGTASPGSETPFNDLQAMIERTRQEGAAGHSIFFSYTARDVYGQQLAAFYDVANNGPAANPLFASGWRPPPVVGTPDAQTADLWRFDLPAGGRYRLVAKVGNFWREIASASLAPGTKTFEVVDASQAELLVDRRPLDQPDFNGDGVVNLADYVVWRDTLGSTIDLRADYDNNLIVGVGDYLAWKSLFAANSGAATQPFPAAAIPEPVSSVAMLMLAMAMGGLRESYRRLIATRSHVRATPGRR